MLDFKKIFLVVLNWVKTKKWWIAILIIVEIFIAWKLGVIPSLFWLVFLSFLFFEWDSRIIAFFALVFLASCMVLLIFKKGALTEQMAIYAYYFLIMTVVLQLVEYRSLADKSGDKEDDSAVDSGVSPAEE